VWGATEAGRSRSDIDREGAVFIRIRKQEGTMAYTIILGIVIVALGIGTVVYTFWHEGSPLPFRRGKH
jgi:hypothetical protein